MLPPKFQDLLRQNGRPYFAAAYLIIVLFVIGQVAESAPAKVFLMYYAPAGIITVAVFHLLAPRGIPWRRVLREHWRLYACEASLSLLLILVGAGVIFQPASGLREFVYALAAGVAGLLIFQVLTDYKNAQFVSKILVDHQVSFSVGAMLHPDHSGVMSREKAVMTYVSGKDVIRLMTTTADDYVIEDRDAYYAVCEKLANGARMQILLFTPIFSLASYLDSGESEGLQISPPSHGQHHLHASRLVSFQLADVIPSIEKLSQKYPGTVETRFFYIKHPLNMVIYGGRRIFSAPILSAAKGKQLPCLEVFPGMADDLLFEKFTAEFTYIWDKPNLYFLLPEMRKIYEDIERDIPDYFKKGWISQEKAAEIADRANKILKDRVKGRASGTAATFATQPSQIGHG